MIFLTKMKHIYDLFKLCSLRMEGHVHQNGIFYLFSWCSPACFCPDFFSWEFFVNAYNYYSI